MSSHSLKCRRRAWTRKTKEKERKKEDKIGSTLIIQFITPVWPEHKSEKPKEDCNTMKKILAYGAKPELDLNLCSVIFWMWIRVVN